MVAEVLAELRCGKAPPAVVADLDHARTLQAAAIHREIVGGLADPRGEVDGTKMSFGGVGDAEDRAAIIAFLRQQSPEPAPLGGE